MTKRAITILCVAVIMALTYSCGTKKTVGTESAVQERYTPAQLLTVLSDTMSWQKLRVPVTLVVESPKRITVSGAVTMVHDRSVQISVTFFGMEVGSFYMSTDSVLVIDRMNKRYAHEALATVFGEIPITVGDVQRLLLGRVFRLDGVKTWSAADLEGSAAEGGYTLVPGRQSALMEYGFFVDTDALVRSFVLKYGDYEMRSCRYSGYTETVRGAYPSNLQIQIPLKVRSVSAQINYKWDKVRWDVNVNSKRPSPSSSYEKISATEILKLLSAQ